jgi:hypothetical protein
MTGVLVVPVTRYRFRCYRRENGECVLNTFLHEQRSNRLLVKDTIATLRQLRVPANHRGPIMSHLKGRAFSEAKPEDARIFFIVRGDLVIFLSAALCSMKKKTKKGKLPERVFEEAEKLRKDYLTRCTNDELGWNEDIPCDAHTAGAAQAD